MTTRHLIDPELLPLLDLFPELALSVAALPEIRAMPMELFGVLPEEQKPEVVDVPGPAGAPDVPLRIFVPASGPTPRPAIFHIHGGGYVVGKAEINDLSNRSRCDEHQAVIASVDYRLAPETPFPGPLEDCYAAMSWLVANCERFGVDPNRIVVLGESAGGGLAAALALLARDRGGPRLAGQFLIYPMIDHRTGGDEDVRRNPTVGEFIWTRESNRFGWASMRGQSEIEADRLYHFSPALAGDLSGLPPSYIATGSLDLFLDEDVDYAVRLVHAGVPTELHVYPGAIHAFDSVVEADVAKRFAADLASALNKAFRKSGS
jgi:triacylglycerol lipase